jgi:hypothetical protein
MQVIFLKGDRSDNFGKFIAWACGGQFCHVELQLDDGECFSSNYPEGVRFKRVTLDDAWVAVPVDWKMTKEVLAWMYSVDHQPYDIPGAICSAFGSKLDEPNAWFCSEVVSQIGSRLGDLRCQPAVNPCELYAALTGTVAATCRHSTPEIRAVMAEMFAPSKAAAPLVQGPLSDLRAFNALVARGTALLDRVEQQGYLDLHSESKILIPKGVSP